MPRFNSTLHHHTHPVFSLPFLIVIIVVFLRALIAHSSQAKAVPAKTKGKK